MGVKYFNNDVLNSPFEFGTRILILLVEVYPRTLDIYQLYNLDYISIYSSDFLNLTDLHPKTTQSKGAILVNMPIICEGIKILKTNKLVEEVYTKNGIEYLATESTRAIYDQLFSNYHLDFKNRANRVIEIFGSISSNELTLLILNKLYRAT